MKKNLMSVVILALVVANLILTAILTISILPQTKQANELITKVCAAIDLELAGGEETTSLDVPLDQIQAYSVNNGESMNINLRTGEDGQSHFAVMQVTLGLNKEDKDFKKYGSDEEMADKEGMIKDKIFSVVSSHTLEEMQDDREGIQQELLSEIRALYGSEFIVSVSYTVTYQ